MIHTLYEHLKLPDSCYLGQKIFKKHFYELDLNATDKKAFVQDIDKITWSYTLKPETINVAGYTDDEREYLEVAVIEVVLQSEKRRKRIGEVIQRSIPYPVLLLFVHEDGVALNVAEKRVSRSDSSKIIVEACHDTPWLVAGNTDGGQKDFLKDFCLDNFSFRNFFELYQGMVQRVIALNCAVHTGRYSLLTEPAEYGETVTAEKSVLYNHSKAIDKRLGKLQELEKLQLECTETRNKAKKEKNMGTQVRLNTRVKELSNRIEAIRPEL